MSGGVNNVHFIGNAGCDPEMRATKAGKDVCSFSLAVNERKDGDTLWLQVVCFDKLAATVKQYVNKGKQVYVSGRLQVREYDAKDGTKKTSVEVVAFAVTFLGGGKSEGASPQHRESTAREPGSDDLDPPPF